MARRWLVWGWLLGAWACAEVDPAGPAAGDAEGPLRSPPAVGPGIFDARVGPGADGGGPRRDAGGDAAAVVDGGSADGGAADVAMAGDGAVDAAARADAATVAMPETCNGVDDDRNGVVDDGGVCGGWVQAHCQLILGWADERDGPPGVSPVWGPCPPAERHQSGNVRCTATQRDGRFRMIDLNGDVDGNDQLGLAFRCADEALPAVAEWIQSRCAVFLGYADERQGPADRADAWDVCPAQLQGSEGMVRCTSTGFDGQFRSMRLRGDVGGDDQLGVAFICRDEADPGRAAAVMAAVEVWLGWADEHLGPEDGAESWGPCPAQPRGNDGDVGCVGSGGDGRFHRLDLGGDVNGDDELGVALKGR